MRILPGGCVGEVFTADERGLRCRGDRPQVIGRREPPRLRDERDVLARLRVDSGDLGEPVAQEIGLLGEPPRTVAALGELRREAQPFGAHGAVAR